MEEHPVKPYHRVLIDDPSVGEPEVRLWRSVLMQALSDSILPEHKQDLMEWVLTQDFETSVELAGLSPVKWGKAFTLVLLAEKPRNIVLANQLKRDTYHATMVVA